VTSQVVFAEPVRTAIGTFAGSLKDVPATGLGSVAISAAVARAGLRPDEVETVVTGNVPRRDEASSLAPFRDRAFSVLWSATVVSNILRGRDDARSRRIKAAVLED
jgi:acetyl-CoA acetyltransferase